MKQGLARTRTSSAPPQGSLKEPDRRDTEWRKVKEIYKLGLKHGMKLAPIAGVNGVYTDEDIARVVELARERRKTWASG